MRKISEHNYEHHFDVRKNKLCPFKLAFAENYRTASCNWHENIEVIWVTKGDGVIRYGSRELSFREGDIIVINSGTIHRLYSDSDLSYYYLIIDESFCAENGITTENRIFEPVFRSMETVRIFEEIICRYDSEDSLYTPLLRHSVLTLLLDLYKNHLEQSGGGNESDPLSERYVKKVIYYMEYRYNEAISLETLADFCGITKHHLAREFKRCTGQTVLTYLNTLRCKNAEVCLLEGMSVTDTALECGFESVSYFSRTYKKIMGKIPSKTIKK